MPVPPERIPLAEPIVAWAVLLLLHVPPPVASVSVEVNPKQIAVVPLIAPGAVFTVSVVVATQPIPDA